MGDGIANLATLFSNGAAQFPFFFGFFSAYLSARFSAVFACGRRPTGHGEIPVVGVVVVVVGGGNNFQKKAEEGSPPILKS